MLKGLKLKISGIFMDNFELGKYLLYVLLGTYIFHNECLKLTRH